MKTGYARNVVNYFKKNFLVQFTYIDRFIHIIVCNLHSWIWDRCDSSNFARSFCLSISDIKPRNFTPLSNQLGLHAAHFSPIVSPESFNSDVKSLSNLPLKILTANVNHLLSK